MIRSAWSFRRARPHPARAGPHRARRAGGSRPGKGEIGPGHGRGAASAWIMSSRLRRWKAASSRSAMAQSTSAKASISAPAIQPSRGGRGQKIGDEGPGGDRNHQCEKGGGAATRRAARGTRVAPASAATWVMAVSRPGASKSGSGGGLGGQGPGVSSSSSKRTGPPRGSVNGRLPSGFRPALRADPIRGGLPPRTPPGYLEPEKLGGIRADWRPSPWQRGPGFRGRIREGVPQWPPPFVRGGFDEAVTEGEGRSAPLGRKTPERDRTPCGGALDTRGAPAAAGGGGRATQGRRKPAVAGTGRACDRGRRGG